MGHPLRTGAAHDRSTFDRPLHVALYSAIVFERDAVSRSLVDKFEYLSRLRSAGYPVTVTGFTQWSDYADRSLVVVPGISNLLRHPEFARADVHVFEYGMWYELFNALLFIDKPTLVIDHNTTPPHLLGSEEMVGSCEKARLERHNLSLATRVACCSEFTRDEVLGMGFERRDVSVLHLPPPHVFDGVRRLAPKPDRTPEPVRLIYVGRLVQAKGVLDLIRAVDLLRQKGISGFTLTIAGSLRFAEPAVVDALSEATKRSGDDVVCSLVLDATDRELEDLYGLSDALVMPSHHEGYCVPVVEALASGCYVIGSDAGNLPNVMGGLGTMFQVGSVSGLANAIATFVGRVLGARRDGSPVTLPTSSGDMDEDTWRQAVTRHLTDYSKETYERKFTKLLRDLVEGSAQEVPRWLADLAEDTSDLPTQRMAQVK